MLVVLSVVLVVVGVGGCVAEGDGVDGVSG